MSINSTAIDHESSNGSSFVKYLHLFRGVAILQIVFLHSGRAVFNRGFDSPIPDYNPLFIANDVLFRNATIYFTLISGILFAHLFSKRDFFAFFRARLLFVGVPYLIISVTLTLALWSADFLRGRETSDLKDLAGTLAYNLLTGDAWNTYWYIPIILGLYLISPVLMSAVQRGPQLLVIAIFGLLPLVFSRTGTFPGYSTFIYFMGAYVLGLWVGLNLNDRLNALAKWTTLLCIIAIASSIGLIVLFRSGIDMIGITSLRETLLYTQKVTLGVLILLLLRHWERNSWNYLDWLLATAATLAFGIYFLHGPILRIMVSLLSPIFADTPTFAVLSLNVLVVFIGGLGLSWILVVLCRVVLGKRSRLVVGS